MNQQEALNSFVLAELDTLTSKDLSLAKFKEVERRYFSKSEYRLKVRRPSTRDTIEALFSLLIKRGIQSESLANYVNDLPVFLLAGDRLRDDLLNRLDSRPGTAIDTEDLDLIRNIGYFEAAKQIAAQKVLAAKEGELQTIDKEIELKKAEYNSLPSILDSKEPEEPHFDPKVEDVKPWWERFYLKSDPFPRKDGLSDIREEMYEQVLVKTKPFEETLSSLARNNNFLFNTAFLLVGDYGYGKTTFIDYLSYYLVNHDVRPIRITCGRPFTDSSGFLNAFYLRLRNELREEVETLHARVDRKLDDLDLEEQIVALAKALCGDRYRGIVVFLDDYHKHRSHFTPIYEFLGLLQILKDLLTRAHIPVGFIVAGTGEWLSELRANGQLNGFLDNTPIEMPDITPELVVEVFNQRLKAFCYDQTPRSIQVDFVRRLFKENEGGKTGFRDFLTRIISELTSNNLAIINTPINISDATLKGIKESLASDHALHSCFNKLIYNSKFKAFTHEQVRKCLELLISVLLHDGVTEEDRLFADNTFHFLRLKDVGLIQKAKRRDGLSGTRWVGHHRLLKAVSIIEKQFQLHPSDYIMKLFGGHSAETHDVVIADQLPGELLEAFNYLTKDAKLSKSSTDNLMLAWQTIDAVWTATIGGSGSRTNSASGTSTGPDDLLARAERGLEALSSAFFEIDRSSVHLSSVTDATLEQRWQLHWLSDEAITEFFRRVDICRTKRSNVEIGLAIKQFRDVVALLFERLSAIVSDMTSEKFGGLVVKSAQYTPEELDIIEEFRLNYFSPKGPNHYGYVRRIVDHLELRFRAFLYITMGQLFGENEMLKQFDQATRDYAYKNIGSGSGHSSFLNPFDGFTRSQFRQAFGEGAVFRKLVVNQLAWPWRESDWQKFFELFVIENIAVAHQQIQRFDTIKRGEYASFTTWSGELMSYINAFSRSFIENNVYVCGVNGLATDIESCVFRFSLKRPDKSEIGRGFVYGEDYSIFRIKDSVARNLSKVKLDKIFGAISDQILSSKDGGIVEDLMDIEYIVNKYSESYFDVVNAMAFSHHVSKKLKISPWFGSSVRLCLTG